MANVSIRTYFSERICSIEKRLNQRDDSRFRTHAPTQCERIWVLNKHKHTFKFCEYISFYGCVDNTTDNQCISPSILVCVRHNTQSTNHYYRTGNQNDICVVFICGKIFIDRRSLCVSISTIRNIVTNNHISKV